MPHLLADAGRSLSPVVESVTLFEVEGFLEEQKSFTGLFAFCEAEFVVFWADHHTAANRGMQEFFLLQRKMHTRTGSPVSHEFNLQVAGPGLLVGGQQTDQQAHVALLKQSVPEARSTGRWLRE